MRTDFAVIGGGIVGLATAHKLASRFPGHRVTVLEKETQIARHQSSHNSGVLHSGIYYRPGSLRARNCRAGRTAMVEFCEREGVPFEICGKVIVATDEAELPLLDGILQRGRANGIRVEEFGPERLREIEPHARGLRGLYVPDAGIVDFPGVCVALVRHLAAMDMPPLLGAEVLSIREDASGIRLETRAGEIEATFVVNCGGLQSDRIARMAGERVPARIIPFRGEYYELTPDAAHLCRALIYPVPDPAFPFLGVHFTRMIHGGVECGPNAVLAFAREGYTKTRVNLRDLFDSLSYPGLLRLLGRHWRAALGEGWRSLSRAAFLRSLQRLVPEVRDEHLVPAEAGVRAQAIGPDGNLLDDFLILESPRMIHVCNAPSPAATASLMIGEQIAARVAQRLG